MTTKVKRRAVAELRLQPMYIDNALLHLRYARKQLRECGCKRAADYVARALKSAEGAHRHADRMARSAQPARKP